MINRRCGWAARQGRAGKQAGQGRAGRGRAGKGGRAGQGRAGQLQPKWETQILKFKGQTSQGSRAGSRQGNQKRSSNLTTKQRKTAQKSLGPKTPHPNPTHLLCGRHAGSGKGRSKSRRCLAALAFLVYHIMVIYFPVLQYTMIYHNLLYCNIL